jgi:SAM-dependent methyltransferase
MDNIDLSFLTTEKRREDCHEFFGWPYELIDMMFKYSKEYYENPWENLKNNPELYYSCGLYLIRQLSYTQSFGSMLPGQQSRNECDEIIKNIPCSVLEVGCGNGDLAMYMAAHGIKVYVSEHSGIPEEFLKWRFRKYGLNIEIFTEKTGYPLGLRTDYLVANSIIDHLYNPIEQVKVFCQIAQKKIFARPEIDENYDRPAHDKVILKDVPECFKMIREHNAK